MLFIKIILFLLVVTPLLAIADTHVAVGEVDTQLAQKPVINADDRAFLADRDLTCVMAPNWSPINMYDQDEKLVGIAVDYWKLISKHLGIAVNCDIKTSFNEVSQAIKDREYDFMLATSMTDERKRYAIFSKPYVTFPVAIATTDDKPYLPDESFLVGKRVAVGRGYSAYHVLARNNPGIDFVEVDNTTAGLQMLAENKVFAVVDVQPVLSQLIKDNNYSNIRVSGTTSQNVDLRLMIRSDYSQLAVIFNKAIDLIPEQDSNRILSRWLGQDSIRENAVVLTPEEEAWIVRNPTVRVWMTDWPPYLIAKPNQPPQGIAIEYLKLIGERTGLQFSYETEIRSFARLLESMRQHNGPDLIPLVVKTPERETYLSFSENYISSPNVIIGRLQDDLIWDISGLTGKTLAVPRAFKVQEQLAGNYPDIRLVLSDTDEQALQAVATRRADAYVGNLTVASHIIHNRGFSDLRVVAPSPFGDHVLAMGNRKDWPELTAIINKALASISAEEKNAIRDRYVALRYVTRGVSREVMLQRIVTVVAVALSILLLFLVWNWSLRKEVRRRTEALLNEVSERKQQESTLREHQQRLKRLASELTLTEERERRQIAAELHDHVGQSLAVMRMQLAVAKKETNGRKVGSVLDELSDSLRQAIRDTRSIMSNLSSPTLNELGLSAAISDWLSEQIGERHGLQTRFYDDGEPKPLSDDSRAILFRSVRELLMNVVKHAGASSVTVSIQREDNAVKIIVADDGAGMPATRGDEHPTGEGGFGLFSIEERMNDLGGSLSIESSPGQGVRAILTVPFEVE